MLHLQKYVFPRRDQTFTNPRRPDFVARTPRGRRTDSTVEAAGRGVSINTQTPDRTHSLLTLSAPLAG